MRRLLLIVLGALLLFAACRKEARLVDLTAVLVDQPGRGSAKVYIDDNRYACWHNGDYVNVNGESYTLTVEPGTGSHAGAKVAKISDVEESDNGYTAGYPTGCISGITEGGTSAMATVLSVQPYIRAAVYDGTGDVYQQLLNPMVAYCSDEDSIMKFHNVACVLRVVIQNNTGYNLNMHYVTLTASDAYLAGTARVSGIGTNTPAMDKPTSGFHDITVDCNNSPIALNDGDSSVIYVVSAPFENQMLTLRVLAKDPDAASHGDTVYYTLVGSSASTLSLNRNQMGQVNFNIADCGCAEETGRCDYLFWGCGTESNPFLITSKADLLRLRNLVTHINMEDLYDDATYNVGTVYYKQILDIDISSETTWGSVGTLNYAIGSSARPFMANYNGSNHSVTMNTNLTGSGHGAGMGVALFGYVGRPSVTTTNIIRNVVTRGSVRGTYQARSYAGLVGFLRGSTRIIECVNYATISNDCTPSHGRGGTVGGICANIGWYDGSAFQPAGTVSFENCANYGVVYLSRTNDQWINNSNTSFNGTGGICGSLAGATACTFTNCLNEGSVKGNACYVGGLVGYARTAISFTGENVNGSTAVDSGNYVGGIIGYVYHSATLSGTVSNNGQVKGGNHVGGIIGYVSSDGTSVLSGTISSSSTASVSGSGNVGGLIGNISTTAPMLSGTYSNNGSVSGNGAVGGMFGFVGCNTLTIAGDVTNRGVVSGNYKVGGIVGSGYDVQVSSGVTLSNEAAVTSTGSVSLNIAASKTYVTCATGGIIGICTQFKNEGTISNMGNVNGIEIDVGGIVGLCRVHGYYNSYNTYYSYYGNGSMTSTTSSSMSNTGSVMGSNNGTMKNDIGGIVGCVYGTVSMNGYLSNMGEITGNNNVAGIVGYSNAGLALSRVSNSGAISGNNKVGGICGYMKSDATITVGADNNNTVTGSTYVAGIVACCEGVLALTNCNNNIGSTITANSYEGGIVGAARNVTIVECCNYADLLSRSATAGQIKGGIVGTLDNSVGTSYINKCRNYGSVFSGTASSNSSRMSGIIGFLYPSNQTCLYIENCTNTGDIISANNGKENGSLLGGTNRLSGSKTITVRYYNNHCTGEIKGGGYTGGLVGYCGTATSFYLENCSFNGKVTSTSTYSSALGNVHSSYSVTNCYVCDTTGQTNFYRVSSTNQQNPPANSSWFNTTSNPGNLTDMVTVDALNYSLLGDALRAWQTANPTYTAWTSGAIPTLNY